MTAVRLLIAPGPPRKSLNLRHTEVANCIYVYSVTFKHTHYRI